MATVEDLTNDDEIRGRIEELKNDLNDMLTEASQRAVPSSDDDKTRWNDLNEEVDRLEMVLEERETMRSRIEHLNSEDKGEHVEFQTARPGAVRGEDIYDLTTIRASFTNPEQARNELHDRAKRSVESATFADHRVRREDAQEHVERLLDKDTEDGELARLILSTGSPAYRKAFKKVLAGREPTNQVEQRAFSLATTGLPVPYTLDPTVLPVSNSVVNPLRRIASVEQIVGSNEWRGLTAAGITASRVTEGTEATDNTPVLAQPTVPTSKVHCFVPFSIESGQDWTGMDAAVARLIADAKDDEEAAAFYSGNGTPPNPSGVNVGVTGQFTAQGTGLLMPSLANLVSIEGALPPRFRPRAQWMANRAVLSGVRLAVASNPDVFVPIREGFANNPASEGGTGNTGYALLQYPVNELSTMPSTVTNNIIDIVLGDFSYFKIIDRIGMTIELVPHLFGATARYPIGQRGFYAYYRNGSKVLNASSFAAGRGTT
jgi:HK97 family phage major capsid protein